MQGQIKQLDFTGQNIYAGIDVHKSSWQVSIMSEDLYHKTFNQPPDPEVLHSYLCKNFPKGNYFSVYEAGFCGFWIHEKLQSLGIKNIVVNPADVPSTDKEKKQKTDKVDSNKLAKQLRRGNLDGIYIHKRSLLEDRNLIRVRHTLVKDLTRYKNRVKSELYFFGIEVPEQYNRDASYWSNPFLKWLAQVEFQQNSGNDSFRILINQVIVLRSQLLEVNRKVRAMALTDFYRQRVSLLRTIPGIGITTAMVILTEIEDINRFKTPEKLRSYVGLTPTSRSSGEKQVHGDMINRGNSFIKSTIIESSWIAARLDPVLHKDFINYFKRMNKNKATVRIACKLLNRIYFVLKNELPYSNGIN